MQVCRQLSCRDTKRYKHVVCGKFLKQKPKDFDVLDATTVDSWVRQNLAMFDYVNLAVFDYRYFSILNCNFRCQ